MTTSSTSSRSLVRQISVRLVAAALLVSLIEIVGVLIIYSRNLPKLAEQLIDLQADRIHSALSRKSIADVQSPYGADDWTFTVQDEAGRLIHERAPTTTSALAPLPARGDQNWTRRSSQGDRELLYGARHIMDEASDFWITVGISGPRWRLFGPIFAREAYHHVIVPVAPVTILVLLLNVYIVRKMLAPLSASAAEVDALDPSRMTTRLSVPSTPREVRALVLAVNRALDRLQQAMNTLESFTADAAHEMRTPLAILKLRIDALEPSPTRNLLREDVAAMTRLVNQMLDLAQADTLDAQMNQTVDLAPLARDVVSRMLPVAVARGCDIQLFDHGGGAVKGHAEALARVLANLIDNAIAHSPADGSVDVTVGPGPKWIVRDHGAGIAPEASQQLFRRFWRGPAPGRAGAGLGLAIAQSILSRHGANIRADNAADGGAVFTIQWSKESAI